MHLFLLTPLREGRPVRRDPVQSRCQISTHAPAGGATQKAMKALYAKFISTHAPAGGATGFSETMDAISGISTHAPAGGATRSTSHTRLPYQHFYSRPCGRGDVFARKHLPVWGISTHAPAGGATAIFHKSVMRFCGKLPKDDTVLCLASFGFPRRDPKAVYLAWISCANLPQKCVRQGLALKDQGTSCFHEGLASHAFDPVLV